MLYPTNWEENKMLKMILYNEISNMEKIDWIFTLDMPQLLGDWYGHVHFTMIVKILRDVIIIHFE